MKGKTAVKSDYALDGGYQYSMLTTGKEWAKQLPNMYIWLDYCCIPQPGAAAGGVHAAQHSDHREGEGDLVAQLKAAVNSIPSYLARSTMMWVLVPPVAHQDVQSALCDFEARREPVAMSCSPCVLSSISFDIRSADVNANMCLPRIRQLQS